MLPTRKFNLYGPVDHEGLLDDEVSTHLIGTQEILLFYAASLLRALVLDSAKVCGLSLWVGTWGSQEAAGEGERQGSLRPPAAVHHGHPQPSLSPPH